MPDRNPTLPLYQSLRLRKNCCILLVPFLHCRAHLWGKRGGFSVGGGGDWKCEMMMDDDEMKYFLHSLYNGIRRARGWHSTDFWLYFCSWTLLAPCMLLLWNRWILKTLRQNFALAKKENWWPEKKMELKNGRNKIKNGTKIIRENWEREQSNNFNFSEDRYGIKIEKNKIE